MTPAAPDPFSAAPAPPHPWASWFPEHTGVRPGQLPVFGIRKPKTTPAGPGTWWRAVVEANHALLVAASAAYPGSASQLRGWLSCTRKWGIEKVDGDRGDAQYLDDGVLMHRYEEAWLLHGTMPPVGDRPGQWAQALTDYVPRPGTSGLKVEGEFLHRRRTGVWYAGAIDWEVPPGRWAPADAPWYDHRMSDDYNISEAPGVLGDHKSCSNIKAYALTAATLPADEQGWVYADRYFHQHASRDVVGLQWTYVQKDNCNAVPVYAMAGRAAVTECMDRLDYEVLAMIAARILLHTSGDASPRYDACGALGFNCWNSTFCEHHEPGRDVPDLAARIGTRRPIVQVAV